MNKQLCIQLHKIKLTLAKQLSEIEINFQSAMPKDLKQRDQFANELTFGKYDYPLDGFMIEKVFFVAKILKRVTVGDIRKYMVLVGEPFINDITYNRELQLALTSLVNSNKLIEVNNENLIKYEIKI